MVRAPHDSAAQPGACRPGFNTQHPASVRRAGNLVSCRRVIHRQLQLGAEDDQRASQLWGVVSLASSLTEHGGPGAHHRTHRKVDDFGRCRFRTGWRWPRYLPATRGSADRPLQREALAGGRAAGSGPRTGPALGAATVAMARCPGVGQLASGRVCATAGARDQPSQQCMRLRGRHDARNFRRCQVSSNNATRLGPGARSRKGGSVGLCPAASCWCGRRGGCDGWPEGLRWQFSRPPSQQGPHPPWILPDHCSAAQLGRPTEVVDLLARVPDPRDPRGVRYPLTGRLAVAVTAVLAGGRRFAAIGEWAGEMAEKHLTRLGIGAAPDESTLRQGVRPRGRRSRGTGRSERSCGPAPTRSSVGVSSRSTARLCAAPAPPPAPRRTWSRRSTTPARPCSGSWRSPPRTTTSLPYETSTRVST